MIVGRSGSSKNPWYDRSPSDVMEMGVAQFANSGTTYEITSYTPSDNRVAHVSGAWIQIFSTPLSGTEHLQFALSKEDDFDLDTDIWYYGEKIAMVSGDANFIQANREIYVGEGETLYLLGRRMDNVVVCGCYGSIHAKEFDA